MQIDRYLLRMRDVDSETDRERQKQKHTLR